MNSFTPTLHQTHWVEAIAQLRAEGRAYVLLTLLGSRGSTPRDDGTKMVVSVDAFNDLQCYSTIGGGTLEMQAIEQAAKLLAVKNQMQHIEHYPLGAKLGQCCGGAVSVLFEYFAGSANHIVLFGAGHVGQALVSILAGLECQVYWIDSRENLLEHSYSNVKSIAVDDPVAAIATLPEDSYYIVMTHNHALDFAICEAVMQRDDARYLGLIGSETKWQRFQIRFARQGFHQQQIETIHCPIGMSAIPGKKPMEVAVSIAGELIADYHHVTAENENIVPSRKSVLAIGDAINTSYSVIDKM